MGAQESCQLRFASSPVDEVCPERFSLWYPFALGFEPAGERKRQRERERERSLILKRAFSIRNRNTYIVNYSGDTSSFNNLDSNLFWFTRERKRERGRGGESIRIVELFVRFSRSIFRYLFTQLFFLFIYRRRIYIRRDLSFFARDTAEMLFLLRSSCWEEKKLRLIVGPSWDEG